MIKVKPAIEVQTSLSVQPSEGHLEYPAGLTGFQQTDFCWELRISAECRTKSKKTSMREIPPDLMQEMLPQIKGNPHWTASQCFRGTIVEKEEDRLCQQCGHPMHIHSRPEIRLQHLPCGSMHSVISLKQTRYVCLNPACPGENRTVLNPVPFQAPNHRLTTQLHNFIEALCEMGYTQKEIGDLTGTDRHIIRSIDKARLERRYTEEKEGNLVLKQPSQQAVILGIDEFKLHNGREYATLIMDMDTGHILWLQHSKKKQVVYDFIAHVGEDWMKNVKAVCSDMNADFAAAFLEKCPHLEIVYDRFHLIKNFNEMVNAVRKDEYKRLQDEGDKAAAAFLKGSKYILTSKRSSLQKKDQQAAEGKVLRQGSSLFRIPAVKRTGGKEAWYDKLLKTNELLFVADYVREQLNAAYQHTDRVVMKSDVQEIIAVCRATQNKHFERFANLLENHLDGITAHAVFPRSSGKVEGTNNRIKTIRRQAYGYRDDTYFFLKIMDASRHRRSHIRS